MSRPYFGVLAYSLMPARILQINMTILTLLLADGLSFHRA